MDREGLHTTEPLGKPESPQTSTACNVSSLTSAATSSSTSSTSKSANDGVAFNKSATSKDRRGKSRKRKRESFAWLYRDLSFEDEYNIGTEDGDDFEDEDMERKEKGKSAPKLTPPKESHKPRPESSNSNPAVQNQTKQVKLQSLPYVEFHFRQNFLNYSATRRKVRTRSCIIYLEPTEIYVSDLNISTHIEDDSVTPRPQRVAATLQVWVRDENHLPFKKRKRFLNPDLDSLDIKTEVGHPNDKAIVISGGNDESYLPFKKRKRLRNPENWEIFDKKVVTESPQSNLSSSQNNLPFKRQQRFLNPKADSQDVTEASVDESCLPFKKRQRFTNPETELQIKIKQEPQDEPQL